VLPPSVLKVTVYFGVSGTVSFLQPAKGSRTMVIAASRARPASTNFLDFFISESSFIKLYFFPSKLPG